MENYIGYTLTGLLVLSAVLLGILIPGGPIENRNFSHISPLVLGLFNTFLTVLGVGSLILAYFTLVDSKMAFIAAAICGISYFVVYALDLAKIFPVSPDRMPRALFAIEVIGLLLAIPLLLLSLLSISRSKSVVDGLEFPSGTIITVLVLMVVLGVGIVIYATKSAMRKLPNKANSADAKRLAAEKKR